MEVLNQGASARRYKKEERIAYIIYCQLKDMEYKKVKSDQLWKLDALKLRYEKFWEARRGLLEWELFPAYGKHYKGKIGFDPRVKKIHWMTE